MLNDLASFVTDLLQNPARRMEFSALNWRNALGLSAGTQAALVLNNTTVYSDFRSVTLFQGSWLIAALIAWSGPTGAGAKIKAIASSGVSGITKAEVAGSSSTAEQSSASTDWLSEKTSSSNAGLFTVQSSLTLAQKTKLTVQVSQRVATVGNTNFLRESVLLVHRLD